MAHTSTIHLLKNISLSMDYADTIVFNSIGEQTNYFLSKVTYSFVDLMYIDRGLIRIDNQAGLYRTCNYVMYTNPDYPNKWFYGFITSVDYLADGTTTITYTEDFLQTWYFDMIINPCMVQREHVNNDTIGANLKEEPVSIGDYKTVIYNPVLFTSWVAIVASAISLSNPDIPSSVDKLQGTLSGLNWTAFSIDSDGIADLRAKLDSVAQAGKSDAIISIWSVPSFLIGQYISGYPINDSLINNLSVSYTTTRPNNLDGYVPKNNKLFTYPYCALEMGTFTGQNVTLRYEFFSGDINVSYRGSPSPQGRIVVAPNNYAGVPVNFDYSIPLGNFPQGSWTQDVYSNWLATESIRWDYEGERRQISTLFETSKEAATGLTNLALGDLQGGIDSVTGMINTAVNYEQSEALARNAIAEEKEIHSIIPPSAKGSFGNESTLIASNNYGFKLEGKTITKSYAESIDNYFTMYGYRVDIVKVPNIFGRESFNYVKTIGAIVTGTAPLYAKEGFKALLNKGIRFWHGDFIGDFTRSNNIIGGK